MNKSEFDSFANQGYNRIPLSKTVQGDLDTPLSVYLKLGNQPFSYLLESAARGGDRWSRYSIIGLAADKVIRVVDHRVTVERLGVVQFETDVDNPLEFIRDYQRQIKSAEIPSLPRFFGGLVGFFGYDTIRFVEKRLQNSTPPDKIGTPDVLLMESNEVVVFDNVSSQLQIIVMVDPSESDAFEKGQLRLSEIARKLDEPLQSHPTSGGSDPVSEEDFVSEFGQEAHGRAVERIKDYIHEGDVMQVVLAQQMSIPFKLPPIQLYRALRSLNPSPYMYFMQLDDFHIVGSSPEILAQLENGKVVNRPLAGTRPRGKTPEEDLELEQELLADPKEIAEHLMLIDLCRNDIGRVCKIGSVRLTEQFQIERYSHVLHIASHVEGDLAEGKTAIDVLAATLPVGTLSGAPKIRAMEIIDELESVKRGVYGGAIGYLAWNGNMDMAIAIRTAVIREGTLYVETGAGIVADSVPELEWQECMHKARSMFRAATMAQEMYR